MSATQKNTVNFAFHPLYDSAKREFDYPLFSNVLSLGQDAKSQVLKKSFWSASHIYRPRVASFKLLELFHYHFWLSKNICGFS